MKRVLAGVILLLGLAHILTSKEGSGGRIVLPNSSLLRCKASDCSRLWPEKPEANAVFPKQLIVDMNQDCLYGMTALYDKPVSAEEIMSAIDEHFAQRSSVISLGPQHYVWRVEPEKFAISLSVASKKDERRHMADAGSKQVLYLAFGGRSACDTP
jgi:hypothetical protein